MSVKLVPLVSTTPELTENIVRTCNFCCKKVAVTTSGQKINFRLGDKENYYCSFCIRHNFHTRNNKHVLILSFRGLIGYYYYEYYLGPARRMWLCEIEDYVQTHAEVGLLSPVFTYDPDTFLWFVDFARIGTSKKKIKIEEILKTIVNILATFNLPNNIVTIQTNRLYQKFKEAILCFYSKRYRPGGRRMLIPTLTNCINYNSNIAEKTRFFVLSDLKPKEQILEN